MCACVVGLSIFSLQLTICLYLPRLSMHIATIESSRSASIVSFMLQLYKEKEENQEHEIVTTAKYLLISRITVSL